MSYNVPNATDIWNQTGFISFVSNQNTASGDMIAFMMLMSVFVIGMVVFSGFTRNARLVNSMTLTFLSSAFLAYAGVVPGEWIIVTLSILLLFILFDLFSSD